MITHSISISSSSSPHPPTSPPFPLSSAFFIPVSAKREFTSSFGVAWNKAAGVMELLLLPPRSKLKGSAITCYYFYAAKPNKSSKFGDCSANTSYYFSEAVVVLVGLEKNISLLSYSF